jgi:predicted dehydrogenase
MYGEAKMAEQERLRVGIVGCGYQGGVLAQAIAKTGSLQVVACADPDASAADRLASTTGHTAAYASVEELLKHMDVDVVAVATPHHILYEASLAAIHAGKHVLTEKPCGLDEKELAQLEAAVEQRGISFMAGYSFRYFPALQRISALLSDSAIGEIYAVNGSIGGPPLSTGWRSTPETGGGPLLYIGSHLIDQILWSLNDEPVEVFAQVDYRSDTKADKTSSFQIKCSRGALAHCLVTQESGTPFYHLEFYGRHGYIRMRGAGFFNQIVDVLSTTSSEYAYPTTIAPVHIDDPRMVMHIPQLEEFAGAIRARQQPSVTVKSARRVMRVCDAVAKSSRTGLPVQL